MTINISIVLILMLFAHVVDDYYLQGILAKFKQKSWWKENAPDEKYKYDWIVGLTMHSISWATMILLPILIVTALKPHWGVAVMFVVNAAIHGIVDHLKANKRNINLMEDQIVHVVQIVVTWAIWAFALI